MEVVALTNGSLDGLILLRQGLSQMAGCHLFDPVQREYNRPFVAHLFPDRPMALVTLAERVQGLVFQSGNPKHIRDLSDFARSDVVIRNRNRGSGTRLWLDASLQLLGIPAEAVQGYPSEVSTHTQLARAVHRGRPTSAWDCRPPPAPLSSGSCLFSRNAITWWCLRRICHSPLFSGCWIT